MVVNIYYLNEFTNFRPFHSHFNPEVVVITLPVLIRETLKYINKQIKNDAQNFMVPAMI